MDGFEFWYNFYNLFVQGALHIFFSMRFTGKKMQMRYVTLYFILLYIMNMLAAHCCFCGVVLAAESMNACVLLTLCGMNHFVLGNSWFISCVTSILALYVPKLSYGIINSVEALIFPYALEKMHVLYPMIVIASLTAMLFSICCYRLILKCFSFKEMRIQSYVLILLPVCFFFLEVESYISCSAYSNVTVIPYPVEVGKQLVLFVLQAAGLAALLSTLYAYQRVCQGFQAQMLAEFLTQEIHAQKNYVEEAQTRYRKTKAFRHDIKNHLSVLLGLIRSRQIEQAEGYLNKLTEASKELSFPCQTGNAAVDILLDDKLEIARMRGIRTEIDVILPEKCCVEDLDLCVIFANAADNAIQACDDVDGCKYICITGERQGDFYMLEFENSCKPGLPPKLGTGLLNIKETAEKYKGTMVVEKKDTYFRLNVLLDISNDNQE